MERMKDNQIDVVVAGLAVVDVIGRPVNLKRLPDRGGLQVIDNISLMLGGNVCNVGIDLAKLGFRVCAITRVGKDFLGKYILEELSRFGIHTGYVTVDRRTQTSATIVCVDKSGERTFLHTRGCIRNLNASHVIRPLRLIRRAKILTVGYLGLLSGLEQNFNKIFRLIKEHTSVKIVLDTGGIPRKYSEHELKRFLPFVDYFIPSYEEARRLTGRRTHRDIVRFLSNAGATNVVGLKLGAKGCYISDGRRAEYLKSIPVKRVVDATGAGDAFMAGFIAATLKGYDPFAAARLGNAVAASCIQELGASTAIKNLSEY